MPTIRILCVDALGMDLEWSVLGLDLVSTLLRWKSGSGTSFHSNYHFFDTEMSDSIIGDYFGRSNYNKTSLESVWSD